MLNIKYLAALREIRLGVFSNNRNNLCNNNYNHIILHPHGLQAFASNHGEAVVLRLILIIRR